MLFFELRILYQSLVIAFFVAVGMVVSVLIPNPYVAALSPFLAFKMISDMHFALDLPTSFYFAWILSGDVRVSSSLVCPSATSSC